MKRIGELNKKAFSLLGLLLALVIVGVLTTMMIKSYVQHSTLESDPSTKTMLKEQGIDTSNQKALLESTKARIKALEQKQQEDADHLMDVINDQYR